MLESVVTVACAVSTCVLYAALACQDPSEDSAGYVRLIVGASQRVEHLSWSWVFCNVRMMCPEQITCLKQDRCDNLNKCID